MGISRGQTRWFDECRPLHGRSSLGLTVEQFPCHIGGSINDDLVLGADDMLSPGYECLVAQRFEELSIPVDPAFRS
jgi:hypothetical protein